MLLALAMLLSPRPVFAETRKQVIEFPEEELASESVLPVFDKPEAVKSRIVNTAHRLELGIVGSYSLTEPFFNPLAFGGMVTYHFNEISGINIFGQAYMSGISSYAKQLDPIPTSDGSPGAYAHLEYAPAPKYLLLANYQYTGFYGKISLTKDYVMNLHLYGLAGIGAMGVGDSTAPVGSIGIGQKFYFGPNFAFRFDLRGLLYNGPDVLSQNLSGVSSVQSSSIFQKKLQTATILSAGIVYLLPSF